jgi:hypothetical protein
MIGDMRSFVAAVAVLAGACGEVVKAPDAATIDMFMPDSPNPMMCGTGEMNCNGTCANVMTSELFCGNCTTQCSPTQGCLAGSCVPANTTCARVRELEPTAPDGLYRNPNTSVSFYCDFTNSMTYDAFAFGAFNIAYAGHTLMSSADFNSAPVQKAFIALYNSQGGLINIGGAFSRGSDAAFQCPQYASGGREHGSASVSIELSRCEVPDLRNRGADEQLADTVAR